MYGFNVFRRAGFAPRANEVVYGIGAGLLPMSVVAEFEEYMITSCGAEGSSDLLVFEGTSEEAVRTLEEAGYVDDGKGCDSLRLAVLKSLDSEGQQLLDDIEGVYADFNYPLDMEPFIYYMPNSESEPSPEDLVLRFRTFLQFEKDRLGI